MCVTFVISGRNQRSLDVTLGLNAKNLYVWYLKTEILSQPLTGKGECGFHLLLHDLLFSVEKRVIVCIWESKNRVNYHLASIKCLGLISGIYVSNESLRKEIYY